MCSVILVIILKLFEKVLFGIFTQALSSSILTFFVGEGETSSVNAKKSFSAAIRLYKRALVEYEKVLGPDNPDTLSLAYNLALLSKKVGNDGEGQKYYTRALEGFEKTLGPDHTYTKMAARISESFNRK